MDWKEFLKPTLMKIIINFIVIFLFFAPIYGVNIDHWTNAIARQPSGFVIFFVLYYYFSCSINSLYDGYRKNKFKNMLKNKKILLGLFVFNPLTIILVILEFF